MKIVDLIRVIRARRKNRDSQTVLKINEFYNGCKEFSYKYKRSKWVTYYDIETSFQMILSDEELTDFTTEILVRLKVSIESMQKKMMVKTVPLKALKILFDTARKSIVI